MQDHRSKLYKYFIWPCDDRKEILVLVTLNDNYHVIQFFFHKLMKYLFDWLKTLQTDSSNFSTVETESFSIDSGVATVLHITAEDLKILNVTLRVMNYFHSSVTIFII